MKRKYLYVLMPLCGLIIASVLSIVIGGEGIDPHKWSIDFWEMIIKMNVIWTALGGILAGNINL